MTETFRAGVVVTGLGAVTAGGDGVNETWAHILQGKSGARAVEAWDATRYPAQLAAEIKQPLKSTEPTDEELDRCHLLVLKAVREALADARLLTDDGALPGELQARSGISLGTSLGGMLSAQRWHKQQVEGGQGESGLLHSYPFHALVDLIAQRFRFGGPRLVVSTACTASTVAIGNAIDWLENGEADVVLCGGADPLSEFSFAGFSSMQSIAKAGCAPFSERLGITIGEGAAMLVLERAPEANARGARCYAQLRGYALTADAFHPTSPDPSAKSQIKLLELALKRSETLPEEIDYVNAHGTGTQANDACETRALRVTLGERAGAVAISSVKGSVGHTLGAAGAIEALVTSLTLAHGQVPPTAGFTQPRRGCDLDYVPRARTASLRAAISQNFAFGGNNAALVLGRADRALSPVSGRPGRRVVVTGLGAVTPLAGGLGVGAIQSAIESGEGALREQLETRLARLCNFEARRHTRAETRRLDRNALLTLIGAEAALRDSGIQVTPDNQYQIGVIAGTFYGPAESCDTFHRHVIHGSWRAKGPALFPSTVFNAGLGATATHLRLRGPNVCITIGHASGLYALAYAAQLIRGGLADAIVVGGVDEAPDVVLTGMRAAGVLGSSRGGDPFGVASDGLAIGEGSAFIVLEAQDSALKRGARVRAEVLGTATGAAELVNTRGRGSPDPAGGLAGCMRLSLQRSKISPREVDLVCSGAGGHRRLDQLEASALRELWPEGTPGVFAPASLLGTSSASSMAGVIAAIVAGEAHKFPSGLQVTQPDPHLNLLTGKAQSACVERSAHTATSFGGSCVSAVLEHVANHNS